MQVIHQLNLPGDEKVWSWLIRKSVQRAQLSPPPPVMVSRPKGVAISDLQNLFKRVLKVFGLRRITGLVDAE
jgi:hypothetical protein